MNKKLRLFLIAIGLLVAIVLSILYKMDYFSSQSDDLLEEGGQYICTDGRIVDELNDCKKPPK